MASQSVVIAGVVLPAPGPGYEDVARDRVEMNGPKSAAVVICSITRGSVPTTVEGMEQGCAVGVELEDRRRADNPDDWLHTGVFAGHIRTVSPTAFCGGTTGEISPELMHRLLTTRQIEVAGRACGDPEVAAAVDIKIRSELVSSRALNEGMPEKVSRCGIKLGEPDVVVPVAGVRGERRVDGKRIGFARSTSARSAFQAFPVGLAAPHEEQSPACGQMHAITTPLGL